MLAEVLLQTLKFTLLAVGYLIIASIPLTEGEYPVVDVGSAEKSATMSSVAATPAAATVTAAAHVPDAIAEVPSVAVPFAIVDDPLPAGPVGPAGPVAPCAPGALMSQEVTPLALITTTWHPFAGLTQAGIVPFAVCPFRVTPFVVTLIVNGWLVLFWMPIMQPLIGEVSVNVNAEDPVKVPIQLGQ
jgi:hypothetical protein